MLFEKQAILDQFYLGDMPKAPFGEQKTEYFKLYHQFLQPETDWSVVMQARCFLESELDKVENEAELLTANSADLKTYMENNLTANGHQYQQYLQHREAGAARFYFPAKAHALLFLQQIEPTKRVDGAWLYAATRYWNDPKYFPLIQIYLEELGNGQATQNHAGLYKQLLQTESIAVAPLPDGYYRQGCIQLALGLVGDDFLPEMIGFNLAYEQTPLHLLISAYELEELGIDPYYFSLHITIDNAHSGHARQASNALYAFMPLLSAKDVFYRRVRNGAKLGKLGISSNDIISRLSLDEAVSEIFKQKALIGQFSHGNHCHIQGKTVNEWLSAPESIQPLIQVLQEMNWIVPNQDPQSSRFWQLISGERAVMKGVFNQSELQIIHDWIAGSWQPAEPQSRRFNRHKHLLAAIEAQGAPVENPDIFELRYQVQRSKTLQEKMQKLIPYLSPALHSTDLGLWATRQYALLFNPSLMQN